MRVVIAGSVHFSQRGYQWSVVVDENSIHRHGLNLARQLRRNLAQCLMLYKSNQSELCCDDTYEDNRSRYKCGARKFLLL